MWHVSRQVLKKQSISDIRYGPQTEKAHLETGSLSDRQRRISMLMTAVDVVENRWCRR